MATALFDGDRLRDFVAAGEKSPPPVFVGRTEAIADIEAAARRAWKPGASNQGEPGATRILQGRARCRQELDPRRDGIP